jgi:hypothetical protein
MKMQVITAILVLATLSGAYVIDLWSKASGQPESVSSTINQWCQDFPALSFIAGFLAYHLFCIGK